MVDENGDSDSSLSGYTYTTTRIQGALTTTNKFENPLRNFKLSERILLVFCRSETLNTFPVDLLKKFKIFPSDDDPVPALRLMG